MVDSAGSSRRQGDTDDQASEHRALRVVAQVRRVAHIVLPILIALALLLAYQTRSGVEEDTTAATQAVSGVSESVPEDTAPDGSTDEGGTADRPEESDEDSGGSEQSEFLSTGPDPESESPTTDPLAITIEINWSLGSGGNLVATPFLPLDGTVQDIELPNYDSDRNDDPGLTIQIGTGLGEEDSAKLQGWLAEAGDAEQIVGRPTLELWVATKDFDNDKSGRILAGLYECSASGDDCNLLADGDAVFNQATFGADFGRVTVNMSQTDVAIEPERALLLRLATAESSEADLWVAYGTTTYRSFFSVR